MNKNSYDDLWQRLPGVQYERLKFPVAVNRQDLEHGASVQWHSHRNPQLVYTTRGVLRAATPDGSWTLGPYQGLWIATLVSHELQAISQTVTYSVYFDADMPQQKDVGCHILAISALFHELVAALVADRKAEQPDRRLSMIIPLLQQELSDANRDFKKGLPLPKDRRLQVICGELLAAPGNNEPLDNWAVRVGASDRTLERLFKAETGLTFGQWRQQLRLSESIAQLAEGVPVSTIALKLGYQTSSAFITMFKKAMGESPQQYLKNHIEASRSAMERA